MMGCLITIVRSLLAMILGLVIFFGFLFLLLLNNFSDKLLNADFYNETIAEQDTYNRIYSEVLVDDEVRDTTDDLLGGIEVVSHDDIVNLLREIIPPEFIQAQVESSIERTVAYMDGDTERLEIFIDLGPPLEMVKPALFRFIDDRIDLLIEEDPGIPQCDSRSALDLGARYAAKFAELADGRVPESVPSLRELSETCRRLLFEATFDIAIADIGLDLQTQQGLRNSRAGLQREFVAGNTLEVLKLAARPLADPVMDAAIAEVRKELDGQDRLDLVHRLASYDESITEEELRENIADVRDWISRARDLGKPLAYVMLIGGSILMGLVYFPSLRNALRWPGVTLFFTGLAFFVTGKVLESQVPDRLEELVERGVNRATEVPPSVSDLGGDILVSFGNKLTEGFSGPSLTLMIIGAVLFGLSLLLPIFLPRMPFGRRSDSPSGKP